MLVLTFQIYDGFFVSDIFYQILPTPNLSNSIKIRSKNEEILLLQYEETVTLQEGCTVKLCTTINDAQSFKLAFNAPKSISIIRSTLSSSDDFQDELVIPNVTERTIDQLLEEEFLVNDNFANLFLNKCFANGIEKGFEVRATYRSARQKYSGGDESDIIVLGEHNKKTLALLIENKITADKQDRQPQRYIERGINGIKGELWDNFETCLIAPKSYLEAKRENDYYHNYISYEEIIDILDASIDERKRKSFKINQFKTALAKKEKFVRASNIPEAVDFVSHLKDLSDKELPEFTFFTGPPNNKVLWFYYSKDTYPNGVTTILKKEAVTMEFKMPQCSYLITGNETIIKESEYELLIAKSGKSCTIRKTIDPINALEPFDSQINNLESGVQYIKQMDDFLMNVLIPASKRKR